MNERPGSIQDLVAQHARVSIDSNLLIYLMENDPKRAEIAGAVVDAVAADRIQGVMASVGIAEVLTGPARFGDGAAFEHAAAAIRDMGFRIIPMDADTAEDAAWIRGRTGLGLADAIHLACARAADATAFVTNDRHITSSPQLEVLYLDDLQVDEPVP